MVKQFSKVPAMFSVEKFVKDISQRFYPYKIYLVGGSVRDYLCKKEVSDFDFATNASPDAIKKILNSFCDSVWAVGEKFGTICAKYNGKEIQVTTFRSDVYDGVSRHPDVRFETDIIEDLKRRDFTINSIAFDGKNFIDPYNGINDIKNKIIKFTGLPEERIKEDPLRMLRAIRFSTQLLFKIEEQTYKSIIKNYNELKRISGERISQEMDKILLSNNPSYGIRLLYHTNLYKTFIPLHLLFVEQPDEFHHKNVFEHTMQVIDNTPCNLLTRYAALFHDFGKMKTKVVVNGKVHFYGHEAEGGRIAREVLRNLKYPKDFIEKVVFLVKYHLYAFSYGKSENPWTDSAIRRLIRKFDTLLPNFLELIKADITSSHPQKVRKNLESIAELERRIEEIKEREEIEKIKPLLNGNEIMELLNIPPSPLVGKVKNWVFQKQLDLGPSYTKEDAIQDILKEFKK